MPITPLQIYQPAAAAKEAREADGALTASRAEQGITRVQRMPVWHRIVWWLSLAAMLPVGFGVLQMLALLVQAERVRGALEDGLATAQLPKASSDWVMSSISQALRDRNVSRFILDGHSNVNGSAARTARFTTFHDMGLPFDRHFTSLVLFGPGDVVSVEVRMAATELLPRWLGPRLPFVGADEVHVHWEATVGQ